jgi:hypothetical protein
MVQASQRELKLNLEAQPQQKSNTKDMSLDYYTENIIASLAQKHQQSPNL